MQGRWGWTPGKWICGLRIVRTTLRPFGLLRSLLRVLLLYVDAILLAYPIPGVAAILLSENRQRLGDMAADTIVIVAVRCREDIHLQPPVRHGVRLKSIDCVEGESFTVAVRFR